MTTRRFFFLLTFFLISACLFGQATALRDYVGLINQSYHPDIVAYFEKMKADFEKKGEKNAAKSIENFLKGATGSGFIISDPKKNCYIITNYHVVVQAYSLSITFERTDGFKKKFENLKIIAADEELDLALLAFAPGEKPDSKGLSFITSPVNEGVDVYSAGFPVLVGQTNLWQLGRGIVSNASVRFPKSSSDETLMGPYIQHTAQIDPGNSGGPLLVAQSNVPTGYAVVGVNTLSSRRRQAANYSIPASVTQTFINNALNQKPETYRAALDQRLDKFINGLNVTKAVYPHIAEYLSTACVGENAEYAMSEMSEKGSPSVKRVFIDQFEESVIGAMGYAVAWTIESNIRGQQGSAIKASLKEVTGSGEEYTVVLTINGNESTSKWIREYGNWRIRNFGPVASGDKTLIIKKETEKKTLENLRLDSTLHIEAGYAYLFDKAPAAFYACLDASTFGFNVYYVDSDFWAVGAFANLRWGIPAGNLGFMPYIRLGLLYMNDQEYLDYFLDSTDAGLPLALMAQVGLKVTTSSVPGLFIGLGFHYNFFNMMENYDAAMKMGLSATIGYAF